MNLLLDTCSALWWWQDAPRLSPHACQLIADSRNTVFFSAVSAMEMATKVRLGKLTITGQLARNLEAAVAASGWRGLPLAINEAAAAGSLAWQQRDPFDRLLAAQAIHNELVLLTPDPAFTALAELRTLW